MSAGSKCLENMIAGRLQDIMVILRNQCNNKAAILFWGSTHTFLTGSGIVKITTTPAAAWRPRTARQDTEQQCPLCFSMKLLLWAENSRLQEGLSTSWWFSEIKAIIKKTYLALTIRNSGASHFLWREYTYVRKVPKSSMDAPNGSTRQRKVVSVMFFQWNCFYGRKFQGNLVMSAGSKCLENMTAGRLQDIMVILRNQCNNKANLLVTLDSASHSLLREYTCFPDR